MPSRIEPELIFDAHHHLWDLDAVHYPWLSAKGVKRFFGDPTPIQKNYLPEDLQLDIGELPVQKSVHIQVGAADDQHLAESRWVQSQADKSAFPSALVAYCDLEQSTRTEMLDQLQTLSATRGVRQIVGRAPDEDKHTGTGTLIEDPNWHAGLKELARRDLSFDLQLIPDQMESMAEVLRSTEGLRVALCHCGSPWYRDKAGWAMWCNGLKKLAELPNIVCKISGLSMFDQQWTEESLRPVVETVIDTFGPERCMFGSNFPVDKLHCDYRSLWQAYISLSQQYSSDERDNLFYKACARFYSI